MSKPVANWRAQIADTPIFHDIVDENLRFYGPRAAWRQLSRKDLGQRKAIFSGVVDLGYEQSELQAIVDSLGGKRILPLPISGLGREPELGIEIKPPHTGGLMALNSLPFSQYRLAITVDLQAADADPLVRAIQDGWVARTLLRGAYTGSADGVTARAGYKATINAKSCVADIIANGHPKEMSTTDAWKAVQASLQRNKPAWLVYYGEGEVAGDRQTAEAAVESMLFERCFDQITTMRYDNGITAVASRLRDGSTMGDAESRVLVVTAPAKVVVDVTF